MVAWIEQGPAIPDVGSGGQTMTSGTLVDVVGSTTTFFNAEESQNQSAGEGHTEDRYTSSFSEGVGTHTNSSSYEQGSSAGSTYAVDSNGTTISLTWILTAHYTPADSTDPGSSSTSGMESGVTAFTGTYDSWQTSCLSTSESTYNVAVPCSSFFTVHTIYSTTAVTTEGATSITITTSVVVTDTAEVESSWMSLQSSTREAEYLTTSVGTANTGGYFERTVVMPDLCNLLWVANSPMDSPIAARCEAWENSDSFVSDVDPFESTISSSADSDAGESNSAWGYQFDSDTETDTDADDSATQGPTPLLGTYVIQTPAAVEGYQPYTAMSPGDPLYAAYNIDVASTVTDTLEQAERAAGATYLRGAITQVVTLNSADTLEMLSPLGTDTTVSQDVPHGGGYGGVPGDNTLRLFPGIYQLTEYDTAGASSTGRSTIEESTSFTFARGHVYAVSIMDAYSLGAPCPTYMETPC